VERGWRREGGRQDGRINMRAAILSYEGWGWRGAENGSPPSQSVERESEKRFSECKIITAKKNAAAPAPQMRLARTSLTARVKRAPDRKAPLINYYDNNKHFSCRKN
jgi:hypothetical protein